ncbi:MAG: hypothetical protein U0V70_20150 [Terriglobia bacterium]
MFRLHESLHPFFIALENSKQNENFRWIAQVNAGRLLRGPNLFEDVVKTLCTTNCSWSATERMVKHLVTQLGSPFGNSHWDFPTAGQLASVSEAFLRREIRAGYRSAYLLQFAEKVASRKLDLSKWEGLDAGSLYRELLLIKGIGPYAAENIMRLLGHYQHLALDSWCRQKFARIYRRRRRVQDQAILNHYRRFGHWKGLVMWLDLTKDWFDSDG